MRITIDTTKKIIQLEERVNIKDLLKFMEETIKDWESWVIESKPNLGLSTFSRLETIPCISLVDHKYRPNEVIYTGSPVISYPPTTC